MKRCRFLLRPFKLYESHENPVNHFLATVHKIQSVCAQMPSDYEYAKNLLAHYQKKAQELPVDLDEEIRTAEGELLLAKMLLQDKAWEDLSEPSPTKQWEF